MPKDREIRADYDRDSIVVYQAYSPAIAEAALKAQRFVPPFSFNRMTWIKPSLLWLMHRSNWGRKSGQECTLAVRMIRSGWEEALSMAVLTAPEPAVYASAAEWQARFRSAQVYVQWDPERSLRGAALPIYSIQVGVSRHIIRRLAEEWIVGIEDYSERVGKIHKLLRAGQGDKARRFLPPERVYPLSPALAPGNHGRSLGSGVLSPVSVLLHSALLLSCVPLRASVPPDSKTMTPQTLMTWLLLATGFTGGLTLVFAVRHVKRWLFKPIELSVRYSPKGGCTEAVVLELGRARHEILVQAYSFTSEPIAKALVDAKGRGVHVDILLDRSNEAETHTELGELLGQGIRPLIDAEHAIAHNKVMIIDSHTIITGSFNFTNQAEHENAENLLVIKHHRELAKAYRSNFLEHKGHCQPATKPNPGAQPSHGSHQRKAA